MGYRAHVCTTYRVQYGTGCFSAGACDAVNRLLENYEYPDGDGGRKSLVEYCDAEETVMELSREGLGSLVASLENGEAPMQTYMQYAFSHVVGINLEHIIFPMKSSKNEP